VPSGYKRDPGLRGRWQQKGRGPLPQDPDHRWCEARANMEGGTKDEKGERRCSGGHGAALVEEGEQRC
jgi:hypothetical protein